MQKGVGYTLEFHLSECMIAWSDMVLASASKSGKDAAIFPLCLNTLYPCSHNVLSPAFYCVLHQVGSRRLVHSPGTILVGLISRRTLPLDFTAFRSSTLKVLVLATIVVLTQRGRFEKLVYTRAIAILGCLFSW